MARQRITPLNRKERQLILEGCVMLVEDAYRERTGSSIAMERVPGYQKTLSQRSEDRKRAESEKEWMRKYLEYGSPPAWEDCIPWGMKRELVAIR